MSLPIFSTGRLLFTESLAEMTAASDAALFLSQAIYGASGTKDGWVLQDNSRLGTKDVFTRFQVDSARKKLKGGYCRRENCSFLPAKLHYRVNFDVLRTRLLETDKLIARNRQTCVGHSAKY